MVKTCGARRRVSEAVNYSDSHVPRDSVRVFRVFDTESR